MTMSMIIVAVDGGAENNSTADGDGDGDNNDFILLMHG